MPGSFQACVEAANAWALAYAQAHAPALAVCLPDTPTNGNINLNPLSRCCCYGEPYSGYIQASQPGLMIWAISSGELPPGLTFHGGAITTGAVLIDGTPTAPGSFTFTVEVSSTFGISTKTYTITVIEITTIALPDYTVGTPYSFQLGVVGGSGNYAWKIDSGTLPAGLTMDQTGLITGTPT